MTKELGLYHYKEYKERRDCLIEYGGNHEGTAWTAPETSMTPVFRLYNPNAGEHHYTISKKEKNDLVKAGWKYEGVGWYSDEKKGTALYRLYNPNAYALGQSGAHHYTMSEEERDMLIDLGWQYEGIGWYAE